MKKDILRIISESRQFKLLQEAPTPRWVIFALDMLIVALASLMVLPYNLFGVSGSSGLYVYSLFLGVYAIMNLIVGAYKCIVRLSMPYDLLKVFWCVFLSSVIITAISVSYGLLTAAHHPLLGIVPVILIGTMVMSLMMSLRIVVKYMFIHLSRVASRRERVIVLGTSIDSLAVAMTLKDEPRGQFIPVALLTIGDRHKSDTIQGLPVEQFDPNRLEQIFRRHDTNTLIFLNSQTPLMRSGMAEHFINSHIRLRVINQVDEFDVDKESESANISAHVNAVKIEDLLGRQVIKTDSRRVAAALKDSTVLITGAAGSIGSEIVRQVASFGAGKIILLDQAETPMHDLQLEMESKFPDIDIVLYVADVQNRERLMQAFRQYSPRYVFHAAAYKHVPMMERNRSHTHQCHGHQEPCRPLPAMGRAQVRDGLYGQGRESHQYHGRVQTHSGNLCAEPLLPGGPRCRRPAGAAVHHHPFRQRTRLQRLRNTAVPPPDRSRWARHRHTQGHNPLLHDHQGGLLAGA